jgi:pyruvate dehydrogenase (quinone)
MTAPLDWVHKAAALLKDAARPLVLLGEGTRPSSSLTQLVHHLGAAVALSPGCDYPHPELESHCIGRYSFGRRELASDVVRAADVVLGANVDFSEFVSRGHRDFDGKTLVHVFERGREFLRGIRPTISARSVPEQAFAALMARLAEPPGRDRPPWFPRCGADTDIPETAPGTLHPRSVVRALRATMPSELTIAVDIGGFTAHVLSELELGEHQRLFCPIEREGIMGEAMLAALGLHDADLGRRVLVIVGDGGFSMVPPELQRAAEARAKITVLVWQNMGFQAVEEGLRQAYGEGHGLPSGVWTNPIPSFADIAAGWGAEGHVATSMDELEAALRRAFAAEGTVVVVAVVDPSVVSPMHDRFEHVRTA